MEACWAAEGEGDPALSGGEEGLGSVGAAMAEERVEFVNQQEVMVLLGQRDENMRYLERLFGVRVVVRGGEIGISGGTEEVGQALQAVNMLLAAIRQGHVPGKPEVRQLAEALQSGEKVTWEDLWSEEVLTTDEGRKIHARSPGQIRYVRAMKEHDLVFAIGPAGTGKTYLAMAVALAAFKEREVSRIVLVRPAVEAGEKLGFLPGDLQEKVNPYLRPLYDALFEFVSPERYSRLLERGTVEVAPLAYMRGRNLNNCFVILDEGQNTSHEQMKMFLTRLGFGSKAVVTGDITQIDLPTPKASGLVEVRTILRGVKGIALVHLTERDVVRHPLVREIIKAYEAYEAVGEKGEGEGNPPSDGQ